MQHSSYTKISQEQLDRVLVGRRYSPENKAILKATMADGQSVSELAKQRGVTRGNIYKLISQVCGLLDASDSVSDLEWARVSVEMPSLLAKDLILWGSELQSQDSAVQLRQITKLRSELLKSRQLLVIAAKPKGRV